MVKKQAKKRTERAARQRKNPFEKLREKFVKLADIESEEVEDMRRELEECKEDVADAQRALVDAIRAARAVQSELDELGEGERQRPARLSEDFDRIARHPDIEKIDVVGDKLMVRTKPIRARYRGGLYDLGRFRITIFASGDAGCVKMDNLTHARGMYDHPHVREGEPCLGNISEAVPELVADHRYGAAITMCIEFLKTCDSNGGDYLRITEWPLVGKTKGARR